ncbi:MAG: dethiobiotin synthase [Deltaproteobacteria bacterium]|nr:dethiobiotin synthase [Deltaproteobacteria bacterium]
MKTGIFITGTNTEVGKTVVARALVRAFVRQGLEVAAVKPVESGAERIDDRLVPADATDLLRASGRGVDVSDVCAYCFADPVSPHLAARRASKTIEAGPILALLERHGRDADLIVAEGAGGLLVPLSDTLLYADLIARTGFGLVIVSPDVLGTINATLLTIEAARARGIPIKGVILNRTSPDSLGNAEAIALHGDVPILGSFPEAPGADDDTLARLAREKISLDKLRGD